MTTLLNEHKQTNYRESFTKMFRGITAHYSDIKGSEKYAIFADTCMSLTMGWVSEKLITSLSKVISEAIADN